MARPKGDSPRPCAERVKLMNALGDASRHYRERVNELVKVIGAIAAEEYEKRREAAERARVNTEDAREALLKHREQHRC